MKHHLFAYGTLMSEEIFTRVIGPSKFTVQSTPATLTGYRRSLVRGEYFPAITPDTIERKSARVEGVLYKTIPEPAWTKLDHFEGELYYRDEVIVIDENNNKYKAMAYIIKPNYRKKLSSVDWELNCFLKENKARFISEYLRFSSEQD